MTIVGVVGDCTTTTCLALASCWPAVDDAVILEADPSGGSLAGWLDTPASPSLATMVAALGSDGGGPPLDTVMAMTHRSDAGIRFIASPVRSLPAHRALAEADAVLAALARSTHVVLADCGQMRGTDTVSNTLLTADVHVVVHRQETASAAASVVRIERLVELVEHLGGAGRPIVLAVIGSSPFHPSDIAQFVVDAGPGSISECVHIAEDALSAATLAGRSGVSAKRLCRLPLMHSAAAATVILRQIVAESVSDRVDQRSS